MGHHSKPRGQYRRRRPTREALGQRVIVWTHCDPCDKRRYQSKADAKKQSRTHAGFGALSVYECPHTPGHWHIGHLPRAVIRGDIDRHSYYAQEG